MENKGRPLQVNQALSYTPKHQHPLSLSFNISALPSRNQTLVLKPTTSSIYSHHAILHRESVGICHGRFCSWISLPAHEPYWTQCSGWCRYVP